MKIKLDLPIWRLKQLEAFLGIFIDLHQFFLSLSIVFNTYEQQETLKKTSSTQNHRRLRIFSTHGVADPEEECRGPGPSSVFFLKDKDSTHTFKNEGKNCIECKQDDFVPLGHMHCHRLFIATSMA